ncbi:(2Fe-2S)-binding protein [Pontibacter qinzhouensis]|uniref:(2Fe-2S)-binding protein n=1 Tax=Pontibacter qinzhouensis TaxID=2603253 RepID=A0A5C8K1Z2_9BACT|nr:2Fe-2S iron-sulfur cluster-binding protein [Pontibacter qinzhouensis]TXK44630.1 (2Fe-2S)-binding protein [Pontibacter qinzhouensis]
MPNLIVLNLAFRQVEVPIGHSVFQALQAAGLDWMHACGTKGRCTTCRLIVTAGLENFGPLTINEMRYRDNGRLKENERLLCQATLHGDAAGRVPQQTMLPHLHYVETDDSRP